MIIILIVVVVTRSPPQLTRPNRQLISTKQTILGFLSVRAPTRQYSCFHVFFRALFLGSVSTCSTVEVPSHVLHVVRKTDDTLSPMEYCEQITFWMILCYSNWTFKHII